MRKMFWLFTITMN